MKRYIADIIIVAIFFLLALMLFGCSKPAPITHTIADGAKETINTIVATKPECKDVGVICNQQIDAVTASCDLETEKIEGEKARWKWSFWGVIVLIGLYIARKVLK